MPTTQTILWAFLWFLLLGGVFGLLLAIFGKIFEVKSDPTAEKIALLLPGANCGGCGFAGCAALSEAIASGKAKYDTCPVASHEIHVQIAAELGEAPSSGEIRYRAQVMCSGTNDLAKKKYLYDGLTDCNAAMRLAGGSKMCPNGCIGMGSCVQACKFDAIHIINGVAAVDYIKCHACGMCVKACPKQIIKLIPYDAKYWIGCMSVDKGAVTRKYCDVGCLGCRLCEKACKYGAIKVNGGVAEIDYTLCQHCGECEKVCPRKIIWSSKAQIEDGITRGDEDLSPDRGITAVSTAETNVKDSNNKQ
ncbi:MAG: RnfABCDGE type electron transport complex subunit B [Oscillospiraceae bacterium]|nr:RnfABCDGE type electron transport complex subunit B [Oscillospiraceae bacterium]